MKEETLYIANEEHYSKVLQKVNEVKKQLWIGTSDIKDLYVKQGSEAIPFLAILAKLLHRGVDVRLIHAKEPGENFRKDFDKYPILATHLERVLCPRVHFKLMIFDLQTVYIGSANLTGAGIGMKGEHNRNFESGILTHEPSLVNAAITQFDKVWMGSHCVKCNRKLYCGDQIK
jgi:phosphatidylserine/phosphatidylglycerophosphate/cardiolipin synthase-like enzyme